MVPTSIEIIASNPGEVRTTIAIWGSALVDQDSTEHPAVSDQGPGAGMPATSWLVGVQLGARWEIIGGGVALRIPLPIAFLWAVVLAGCGTPTDPEARMVVDGRARPCVDEPGASPEQVLQCPEAIRMAVLRLGLSPGEASALEFYREEDCVSLGMTVPIDCGFVVAWFSSAPPLLVPIRPHRTGGFVAQNPTAPPRELIDRGPAEAAPPP